MSARKQARLRRRWKPRSKLRLRWDGSRWVTRDGRVPQISRWRGLNGSYAPDPAPSSDGR